MTMVHIVNIALAAGTILATCGITLLGGTP